jgi:acetoin utilization deacetylase AcuC-like enzyme
MTKLLFHPIYSNLPLPSGHRFPIQKYQQLRDSLVAQGVAPSRFLQPRPLTAEQVKSALCPDYVERFVTGTLEREAVRRIGFPWLPILVERTFTACAGTVLAGLLALQHGRAINLSGGYHHAFYAHGSGFCIINDLYLCALNLLAQPGIARVLIFDCDVHQGDGTAALAAGRDDIVTVSIHGEKNFPFRKQQSDVDVALPQGTTDARYLETVEATLRGALARFRPDAVIYDAGVDIHEADDLGHFLISNDGIYQRDRLVFDLCAQQGLPVAAVIGGGYQRDLPQLVRAHLNLFLAAGVIGSDPSGAPAPDPSRR